MADVASRRQRDVHYLTTLTISNAIIHVGNVIGAAVSGGNPPKSDALSKTMQQLKELLYPEERERLAAHTEKVKKLLQSEAARGPLKVKVVGGDSRRDRARRRRR